MANRKRVLILYTGGTLGMCKNAQGALEPKPGFLTDEMTTRMSDLRKEGMPEFKILEYSPLVDSSDVRPEDWVRMAKDIHDHYFDYDGFLVAHGTDTMHYTASALSFLLKNLSKPVVITGAMIPLVETYNDARRNIIIALMFAAHPQLCEVCIYFNDVLLRGNRAVKADTTVSAFISPAFPPLAKIQGHSFHMEHHLLLPPPAGPFNGRTCENLHEPTVINFFVTPGFDFEGVNETLFGAGGSGGWKQQQDTEAQAVPTTRKVVEGETQSAVASSPPLSSPADQRISAQGRLAVVLEISGCGNDPRDPTTRGLQDLTRAAMKDPRGVLIVITSQTLTSLPRKDLLRLQKFVPEAVLVDQMTTETATVKAMYLLSTRRDGGLLSLQECKKEMVTDLRGEMMTSNASTSSTTTATSHL